MLSRTAVRIVTAFAAVACVGASALPLSADGALRASAAARVVFGGVTPQDWPVVLSVDPSRHRIARATIAIDEQCSSGGSFTFGDDDRNVRVRKDGSFSYTWGPYTYRNADGTTYDQSGKVRGRFNASGTKVSGTWRVAETDYNGSGAVTDRCSGSVRWSARH